MRTHIFVMSWLMMCKITFLLCSAMRYLCVLSYVVVAVADVRVILVS